MDDNNKIATIGDLNTLLPNTTYKFYSSEEFPFSNDQWCPTYSQIEQLEYLGEDAMYGVLVENSYYSTQLVKFSDCSLKKRNLEYTITLNQNSHLPATGTKYISGIIPGQAAKGTTYMSVYFYSNENLVEDVRVRIELDGLCLVRGTVNWSSGIFPQTERTFDIETPITHIQFGDPSTVLSHLDPGNIIEIEEFYQSHTINLDVSGTIHAAS